MSTSSQMKSKLIRRAAKAVDKDSALKPEALSVMAELAPMKAPANLNKATKVNLRGKKWPLNDEELAEGLFNNASASGAASESAGINTSGLSDGQDLIYAQSANVASDTSGSSDTPTDLSLSEAGNDGAVSADASDGLTTTQMVAFGLLGAAAVGGGAVAITSSSTSSNNSHTTDTTAPQVQQLVANGSTITLTYSEALDSNNLPSTSAFTVTTGGMANAVTAVAVSGNTVTLTLTNSIVPGAIVSLAYTDPTAGNDTNAIQDLAGNDATGFIQGVVADGYISGARIYIDANADGIAQESEFTGVTTNADGTFFLPNTLPNGAIIAVGGINIDTGLEQLTPLKAPAGSTTINPLTTLLNTYISQNPRATISSASAAISASLGFFVPDGLDLTTFNPLASSNPNYLAAQKVAAQIASMTVLGSGGTHGPAQSIMSSLADLIIDQPNVAIDLSSTATIRNILSAVSNDPTWVTSNIVVANTVIAASRTFNEITDAQSAALTDLTNAAKSLEALRGSTLDTTAPVTTITSTAGTTINAFELSRGLARLEGQTEPFTQIQIKLAPGIIRTVYTNSFGNWIYALTSDDITAMGQGQHEISSWSVAEAGNRSTRSTLTLLVDTISPASLIPRLIDESNSGSTLDQTSTDTTPTFSITAELGAKLEVQDTLGSYKFIGTGTGAAQNYTVTLNPLPGLHKLNFLITDAAGNSQVTSYDYTLDTADFTSNLGNTNVNTRPTQLVQPSFNLDVPNATELLNGIMAVVRIELAKLPFVADFASIARFIQSHLTLDLDLTSETFQIGYDNSSSVLYVPLSMNLGFAGLSFDVSGTDNFEVILNCAVDISGGYDSSNDTVYLNTSANSMPCISITASASLPEDLTLTGTLGALSVSGTNNNTHADVTTSLSLTNQAQYFTLEEILQYITYLAYRRDNSHKGSLTDTQIADLDILNAVEPEMFGATSYFHYLPNIVNTVNSRLSNRDDKLTWSELEQVFQNPTNIGSIISASAVATQNISFTVASDVNTGSDLVDTFIPNFSFIASATAREEGNLNSGSLSYTADVSLTKTQITSDILKDVVTPFMQTGDKILSPIYPLVDFFYAPLPWQVRLYESTVPLPSGWSILNPVEWYEYIKGQAKEGLSSGIDGLITGAYSMMDLNKDGQVQFIETLQAPVKLGQMVLQAGLEIVNFVEETIVYIRDNPNKSGAEYGAKLGAIAGRIGGVAGAATGALVGTGLGIAISNYIASNAPSLLEKTNRIENDLGNLQHLMSSLDGALNDLDALLLNVKKFQELTQQFESNELNGSGITMSGIALGNYSYRVVDGVYSFPVDNDNSAIPLQTYVNQSSSGGTTSSSAISGPQAELLKSLAELGIELPILTDKNILGKVLTLQPVDLVTYDPNLPSVNLNFSSDVDLVAVGQDVANLLQVIGLPGVGDSYAKATDLISIFANLQTKFFGSLTIDPNIDFGVDTGGLNSWLTHGMPLDYSGLLNLADGFYTSDHFTPASNNSVVDNPELSVKATLGMENIVSLGWPFVGAEIDVTTQLLGQLLFDINDPNQDGKLRLSEIISNIQKDQALMEVVSPSYLDFNVSGEGSGWLDFTKPIPIEALKSLGLDNGLATALLKVADWVTSAAENRYSLDIPFDATWRLVGTTDNSIFQV